MKPCWAAWPSTKSSDGGPCGFQLTGFSPVEPVGQQQLEPVVARAEVGVVEALGVVGVGARGQQQLDQGAGLRVRRLLERARPPPHPWRR